jgi:general secretion pathway protein D
MRKQLRAVFGVGLLCVVLACVAGCMQTTSSNSPPPPSDSTGGAATFADVFKQKSPANGTPTIAPKAAGETPIDSVEPRGDGSVIYDNRKFGEGEKIVERPVGPQATSGPSGFVPAAYQPAAESGISPTEGYKFQVTLENAEINFVVRTILGDTLKANYVIDPRVHGTITLSAHRPITRKQLLSLLEVALRSQGAVMTNQDGTYRIVPVSEANGVGGTNIGPDAGEPGFGTTALPLDRISADALSKILEGFGAPTGAVKVDAAHNLLLARGTTSERQWVIDTAMAFDVDWMRNQSVGVFPVSRSSPEVVINELSQIADASVVKFQPISRMNAVLAVAKSPDTIREVKNWITRLDRQNDYGPRAHVYRLKSADARKVVSVLRDIFGGGSNAPENSSTAPQGPAAIARAPGASTANPSQPQANDATRTADAAGKIPDLGGGPDANGGGSRLRITADVAGNAIVVYASEQEYKPIERTIIDLDRPTPEVAIEAIAAEVSLTDQLTYGVQYFLSGTSKGNNASIAQLSAALPLAQAVPGFNAVIGNLANPKVVINALRVVTEVKILSSPSLVVADNQPAVLQVGDQVPVTTGTATSTITSQSAIVNSVSYVDTGVILRVTPHIYRTTQVKLEIEQEVSAVEQNANAQTLTPTISQQKVKSTIDVSNGQTVLLAGLISQQVNKEKSGIPGLIDLPFLGNALSNSTNNGVRKELIIFVKPQIIRHNSDAQNVATELRRRMPGFNDW